MPRIPAQQDHEYTEGLYAVLEHYGWDLREPRSGWHTIKCFAHKDSHASCRVNFDIGQVKCQGCDFHGDAINVITYYTGKGFVDAVREYETITGIHRTAVRGTGRDGIRVSGGTRDKRDDRAYIPPRLRGAG